jgi:hypothetical protein
MKFLKLTTAIISLTLLLACITTAQSVKERCDAMRLQPNKPQAVISLDHIELKESPNGKQYRQVWFRLHNNTDCKIVLSTADKPVAVARTLKNEKGIPIKNQNDGLQFEWSGDLANNSLIRLDILVSSSNQPKNSHDIRVDGCADNCERVLQPLRSGDSVLFSTRENNLKKGRLISVEYAYEGEQWSTTLSATFDYKQPLKEAISNLKNLKTQNANN